MTMILILPENKHETVNFYFLLQSGDNKKCLTTLTLCTLKMKRQTIRYSDILMECTIVW